jgi:hypothetical protein
MREVLSYGSIFRLRGVYLERYRSILMGVAILKTSWGQVAIQPTKLKGQAVSLFPPSWGKVDE